MKRNKYHIALAWVLLLCFAAGQYMIYAHQHTSMPAAAKLHASSGFPDKRPSFTEKCSLCDVMHHNAMLASGKVYLQPEVVSRRVYQCREYNFKSIQPVPVAGRAPPPPLC